MAVCFKVDEDLPGDVATLLREAGHDATTVVEQDLTGASDDALWRSVDQEKRCLITADKGFANVRNRVRRNRSPRTSARFLHRESSGLRTACCHPQRYPPQSEYHPGYLKTHRLPGDWHSSCSYSICLVGLRQTDSSSGFRHRDTGMAVSNS